MASRSSAPPPRGETKRPSSRAAAGEGGAIRVKPGVRPGAEVFEIDMDSEPRLAADESPVQEGRREGAALGSDAAETPAQGRRRGGAARQNEAARGGPTVRPTAKSTVPPRDSWADLDVQLPSESLIAAADELDVVELADALEPIELIGLEDPSAPQPPTVRPPRTTANLFVPEDLRATRAQTIETSEDMRTTRTQALGYDVPTPAFGGDTEVQPPSEGPPRTVRREVPALGRRSDPSDLGLDLGLGLDDDDGGDALSLAAEGGFDDAANDSIGRGGRASSTGAGKGLVSASRDPLAELRERYALGDFSGALEIAERLLESVPSSADVQRYAESCRDVLRQMYSARLGPLDQVPSVAVPADQLRWLTLDHRAGFLLSHVDGVSSLEEILDISGMPSLEAMRIICDLVSQKVIVLG